MFCRCKAHVHLVEAFVSLLAVNSGAPGPAASRLCSVTPPLQSLLDGFAEVPQVGADHEILNCCVVHVCMLFALSSHWLSCVLHCGFYPAVHSLLIGSCMAKLPRLLSRVLAAHHKQDALRDVDAALLLRMLRDLSSAARSGAGDGSASRAAHAKLQVAPMCFVDTH